MSRRRTFRALVALAALGWYFCGPGAGGALASGPDRVGWWWALQLSVLPAPIPAPVVPDGGLFVQQGPTGPDAYGAVHYAVPDGATGVLTLTVATGSTTAGVLVQACATTEQWDTPEQEPAAWDDRPAYGSICSPSIVATDGGSLSFSLDSRATTGGSLDVAIVPVAGSTPFAVAFDPPADDSFNVSYTGSTGQPPPTTTPTPPTTAAGAEPFVPPATSPFSPGVPSGLPSPAAPAAPSVTPANPSAGSGNPTVNRVLGVVGLGDRDRGQRAFALGGAALIVVGWWLAATRVTRAPRLLGSIAGGAAALGLPSSRRTGGVGRFARPREGSVRTLR